MMGRSARPVLGVDPGANETGLILRRGGELVDGWVIVRDDRKPLTDYLSEVCRDVTELAGRQRRTIVAVEEVTPPTGYSAAGERAPINPGSLIGTSAVYGAVLALFPRAVVVAPGGHGSAPRAAYPGVLFGPREKVGAGWRRHLRSAWDIAGVAAALVGREHRARRPRLMPSVAAPGDPGAA